MNKVSSESTLTVEEAHRILSKPARRILKLVIERERERANDNSLPLHTVSSLADEYRRTRGRRNKGASYSFLWRNVKLLVKARFLEGTFARAGSLRRFELNLGPLLRKRELRVIRVRRGSKVKR